MDNKKRIINAQQHNCPHCGTKGACFEHIKFTRIDDEKDKRLGILRIRCSCCGKTSTHLIKNILNYAQDFEFKGTSMYRDYFCDFGTDYPIIEHFEELDDNIIMSIPTPTFIIDAGIPSRLRNLLIEAGKCIKENALTGASACIRKAIYEFLKKENAQGDNYDEKIKSIKQNWGHLSDYLDVLKGIKGITSDQVHEDSFENFTSPEVKHYVDILEEIFREIYVIPQQREERKNAIFKKCDEVKKDKSNDDQ